MLYSLVLQVFLSEFVNSAELPDREKKRLFLTDAQCLLFLDLLVQVIPEFFDLGGTEMSLTCERRTPFRDFVI
jgi:hypothetical protein